MCRYRWCPHDPCWDSYKSARLFLYYNQASVTATTDGEIELRPSKQAVLSTTIYSAREVGYAGATATTAGELEQQTFKKNKIGSVSYQIRLK